MKLILKNQNSTDDSGIDPGYTGAFYIRGCSFEKLGEIEKAIDDFSTVLNIDPYHVNAAYA